MAVVCYLLLLLAFQKTHLRGNLFSGRNAYVSTVRFGSVFWQHAVRHQIIQIIGPVVKGEIASLPSFCGEISCKKDIEYVKQGESFEF